MTADGTGAGAAVPARDGGTGGPPTADRMGELLRAVTALGGDLDLPVVLRRIVTTAMEMVNARYGAMGVLDATGRELAEFITAGLDERELADLAGVHPPRGRGVLGMLIDHPEPLRVPDITAHPASV
ncbi:hypothetical protein FOE67_26135, partial [Streptomyces calidiresistens]|nr:hypothetical protein [Streptomyces calidiresistens]